MLKGISNVSFKGTTKIFAVSDTHQETRRAASLLTKMLQNPNLERNGLFLHCGDFYEGNYDSSLERDCYIKTKEARPDLEMVMTIGNHDLGYNERDYKFILDTIKRFKDRGIRIVCANITDSEGKQIAGVDPYTIVKRDGDKNFITGFCTRFFYKQGQNMVKAVNQEDKIDELAKAINIEKPDNVIILNHDFMDFSQNIERDLRARGIVPDLIIGGHDHRTVAADKEKNIYYPICFARSMYCFDLVNDKGKKELKNTIEIFNDGNEEELNVDEIFRSDIEKFEEKEQFFKPISKSVLNLIHDYSGPCPYGSFFADSIKDAAGADIGFFSSGFIKKSLPYEKDGVITKYQFLQSMPTKTPVQTVELNADELKAVFSHSLAAMGIKNCPANQRFLQCSHNVKIEGTRNYEKECFDIKQIFINDEPLLDEKGNPLNKDKTFKCAIDSYIANGGQQYDILKSKKKQPLYINGELSQIREVLKDAIIDAQYKYEEGYEYPIMKIKE